MGGYYCRNPASFKLILCPKAGAAFSYFSTLGFLCVRTQINTWEEREIILAYIRGYSDHRVPYFSGRVCQ